MSLRPRLKATTAGPPAVRDKRGDVDGRLTPNSINIGSVPRRDSSVLARKAASVHIEVNFKSRALGMRPLLIGAAARRTGIRTSALSYYERGRIVPLSARISEGAKPANRPC